MPTPNDMGMRKDGLRVVAPPAAAPPKAFDPPGSSRAARMPQNTPTSVANTAPDPYGFINKMIEDNTHLNFVDRIARADQYPTLDLGNGDIATHKMGWSTIGSNRQPIVYPTVIYDSETQALKQLGDRDALEHAVHTKEFLPFTTPQQADLFSREYKRYWQNGKGPKGYTPPNE